MSLPFSSYTVLPIECHKGLSTFSKVRGLSATEFLTLMALNSEFHYDTLELFEAGFAFSSFIQQVSLYE